MTTPHRPKRSKRKTTKVARPRPKVNPDGSGDAPPPTTRGKQKASSPDRSTATTTLVKTKRTPPTPAPRPPVDGTGKPAPRQRPPVSPLRRIELEMAAAQAVQTRGSFAAKFAKAARTLGGGVTIGIDKDLKVGVIRNASESVSAVSAIADSSKDRRLRDLEETVEQFMAESRKEGVTTDARARFAGVVLGVTAEGSASLGRVADTALEGLRARLHGEPPRNINLPPELVALLDDAKQAWTSTSDAEFWRSLAATAQRPAEQTPEGFLREQAAWMGLVANLSAKDVTWRWASAAEQADLVDTLIDAGSKAPKEPVQAILVSLSTLRRGQDPLPRAIAAELAQLALAALAGVKKAAEPDRKGVLSFKDRPPGPNATAKQRAAHQGREALRDLARSLVDTHGQTRPVGGADLFKAPLFRSKLSTVYTDWKERLRLHRSPRPDDDEAAEPSGEERYQKLLEVLGPLDGALTEALDAWSDALGSGATDPASFVEPAREARAAIEAVLRKLKQTYTNTMDPERNLVHPAVESLAVELGLEAGEVLTGRVAPTADSMAGLRDHLASMREDQRALETWRQFEGLHAGLTASRVRGWVDRQLPLKLQGRGRLDDLSDAVAAVDAAGRARPVDPAALAAAVDQLLRAGDGARHKTTALSEVDRRAVLQVVDVLHAGVANRLEDGPPVPAKGTRWPPQGDVVDQLGPEIARLRASVPPRIPVPAPGVGLDRFWSQQKAAALALLPPELAKEVNDAMNPDLAKELSGLTRAVYMVYAPGPSDGAAAAGDTDAIEAQAWPVVRTLGAYRSIVNKLPAIQAAAARDRLLAALDGVAMSALRLLPPPPPAGTSQDG